LKNKNYLVGKNIKFRKQHVFEVLKFPVVTEKSTQAMSVNRYVFKIYKHASKLDVKNAVETIFNVEVLAVNILNQIKKKKKFRGKIGFRPSYKKASVRLAEGNSIDLGLKV
jgi:large subunit ribosomal protein L23